MLDFAREYHGNHELKGKELELYKKALASGIQDNTEVRLYYDSKAYSFEGDTTFDHEGVTYSAHGYDYEFDPFALDGPGEPWPQVRQGGLKIWPEGERQPVTYGAGGISIVPGRAKTRPAPEQQEDTSYRRERGQWRNQKRQEDRVPAGCVLFICAVILSASGLAIQLANCHALPWGCF